MSIETGGCSMGFFNGWGRKKKTNRELAEEKARVERDAREKPGLTESQEDSTEQYLSYTSLYGDRGQVDPGKAFQLNRGYGFDPVSSKTKSQKFPHHNYRPEDLNADQEEEQSDRPGTAPRIRRPY